MDVVHKGWLTKSPPEKKSFSPVFKVFKAVCSSVDFTSVHFIPDSESKFFVAKKWRRRFFVLHSPPAADSLPGAKARLDYYEDETCKRRRGSIDLEHCHEVVSKLDSSYYQHVFSIETKDRGKDRNYYLVSDSADDMTKWVNCLCWILGLKDAVDDGPAPPPRQDVDPLDTNERRSSHSPRDTQQTVPINPSPVISQKPPPSSEESHEAYIPIWDPQPSTVDQAHPIKNGGMRSSVGSSGRSALDQVPPAPRSSQRRDSIPNEVPPPPPKNPITQVMSSPGALQESTYDKPAHTHLDDNENFQKVPPVNHNEFKYSPNTQPHPDSVYNVPPSRQDVYDVFPRNVKLDPSQRAHRASNSSEGSRSSYPVDSGNESQTYDTPPRNHPVSVTDDARTYLGRPPSPSDIYDVPARKDNTAMLANVPAVPWNKSAGQNYMNLPPSEAQLDDVYDVPPSKLRTELSMPAPPPQPCTTKIHMYKNAPPKPVPSAFEATVAASSAGKCGEGIFESTYLPMAGTTPIDTPDENYLYMQHESKTSSAIYTNMDSWGPGNRDSDIYSVRPSNRPVNLPPHNAGAMHPMNPGIVNPQPVMPAPAAYNPSLTGQDVEKMHYLGLSNRSQSFRRKIDVARSTTNDVPLPTRLHGVDATSSSDEDDESDSVSSHDQSLESLTPQPRKLGDQYLPPKKGLNSTPPPPKRTGQVEYLALDLDQHSSQDSNERSPVFPRSPPPPERHSSPTHYKEIDFVKTKALEEMKNDLEKKRKSSEKSLDEY